MSKERGRRISDPASPPDHEPYLFTFKAVLNRFGDKAIKDLGKNLDAWLPEWPPGGVWPSGGPLGSLWIDGMQFRSAYPRS